MNIPDVLLIAQLFVAFLLIISIMVQSRGAGLSGTFGGDSALHTTRRGAEKFLYIVTIILAICFVGLAIASLLVK
ncbi:MAG: preprotein translocase subunit SecG [Patescibacteria group bacterium]